MKRKLQRFEPCPVIQQYGPFDPPEIAHFKRAHLVCMGPYANDKWYIFYPKPRPQPRQSNQPQQQTPRKWYQFWKKGTYHA